MMSLYWIDRLDYISNSFICLAAISICSLMMASLLYMDYTSFFKKYIITACIVLVISILGFIFVPTSDQYKSYYSVIK